MKSVGLTVFLIAALALVGLGTTTGTAPFALAPDQTAPDAPENSQRGVARSPRLANYTLQVRLYPKSHEVRGDLKLDWYNQSDKPAAFLLFHLYQNAFKHEGTRFLAGARAHDLDFLLGRKGFGYTTVSKVSVDGRPAREVSLEEDGTVLRVTPAKPLPGHHRTSVTLRFTTRLPKLRARSGYHEKFYMVAQWFPKVGVRDPDGTWHCHPYHLTSEFFADFGVYRAFLEVPEAFGVAASGRRVRTQTAIKGYRRYEYLAEDVHDFAWAAGPGMKEQTRQAGQITLRAAHFGDPSDKVARHLDVMARSLKLLQDWLAPYPYPELTVLLVPKGAGLAGGMEYPTLFTSQVDHWPFMERGTALGTTVHELIHQYFYGLLASDEFREPWLDEGFTTYFTGLVKDAIYGPDRSSAEIGELRVGYFAHQRILARTQSKWDPPARHASGFATPFSYFGNVYSRPALALKTLETQIGWPRMRALLREYVQTYRFGHPKSRDFFALVDRHVKQVPLRRFFHSAVTTDGRLDYEVSRIRIVRHRKLRGEFTHKLDRKLRARADALRKRYKFRNRVLLRRLGELAIPVIVELRFADGSVARKRWDGQTRWRWIEVDHPARLTTAVLDPERSLALEHKIWNNGLRTKPDARPARRVAGRLLSGLQLLLQLVGF